MSTKHICTPEHGSGIHTEATATLLRSLGHNLRARWTALRNRGAVRHLATFDDRMLEDIGLNRADVVGALHGSFWADPSERLASTVQARRRSRRWSSTTLGR